VNIEMSSRRDPVYQPARHDKPCRRGRFTVG
jgi:hypothetical protein